MRIIRAKEIVLLATCAVGLFSPAWGQSTAGTIAGNVVADDGAEITDATIRIAKMPSYELRSKGFVRVGPSVGRTVTPTAGAFSLQDLPDGRY